MDGTRRHEYQPILAAVEKGIVGCGAAFAITAKVYQEAGDANKAGDYQTKFDRLAVQAEGIFEQSYRPKSDAWPLSLRKTPRS
ncbi:hypothetical protein E0H32_04515 [Rhizobium leguminosarum bv. viciae]|nr:hypothetical protein E0H32_04515 [Rhizobium leguminosarum bv. viciae]